MVKRTVFALAAALFAACGRTPAIPFDAGIRTQFRIVDATADVGQYSSTALDADGLPGIAYYDRTNGDLKYAHLNPTGIWDLTVVDQIGDVGTFARLRYASNGMPHIIYYDETNRKPKYAFFNGAEWTTTEIGYPRDGGRFLDMRLDLNDVARYTFISEGTFNLEYAIYKSGQPDAQGFTIDEGTRGTGSGGNISQSTCLRLRDVGADQFPVVVYYHASFGQLRLAFYQPDHPRASKGGLTQGWVYRLLDGSFTEKLGADVGMFNDCTLRGNELHVSYYDATNENVKYAYYNFASEESRVEVVDTDGVVGQGTSIVLDSSNIPTIAYYDATNNDLKLAVRTQGQGWRKARVDLKGVVGTYPSMVALDNGQVGISYRDFSRRALKFAVVTAY